MGFTQKFVNKYIKGNEMFYRFINVFSVDVFVRGANLLLIPVFFISNDKKRVWNI